MNNLPSSVYETGYGTLISLAHVVTVVKPTTESPTFGVRLLGREAQGPLDLDSKEYPAFREAFLKFKGGC